MPNSETGGGRERLRYRPTVKRVVGGRRGSSTPTNSETGGKEAPESLINPEIT